MTQQLLDIPGGVALIDRMPDGDRLVAELREDEVSSSSTVWAEYEKTPRPCCCFDSRSLGFATNDHKGIYITAEVGKGDKVFTLGEWKGEMRWLLVGGGPVCLREVLGSVEAYEPARTMTRLYVNGYVAGRFGMKFLREELIRLESSPWVLNVRMREKLVELSKRMSWSEMAMRCGARKVSKDGHVSGDTTWLRRRCGLADELEARTGKRVTRKWVSIKFIKRVAVGLGIDEDELRGD